MRSVLLPRLRDKDSTVRTWAVRASRNFQDPSDDSDITISEIMRLMSSDSSKDVRIAACEAVVICPITLGELVGRMRDVKSDVRAAVTRRLGDAIEFTNLSQKQRAAFVKYSLSDRDEKVRADARAVVLQWLAKRDYDVPKMLKLMGLRTHTAEAEILAWAIIEESQKEGASPSLRSLVTDQNIIDWGTHSTFGDVSCHDLLWTLARCSYFRKLLPPSQAYERVEHLLPDTV
ncbi:NCAPG, partial [Symbiodinium microadriaticum]